MALVKTNSFSPEKIRQAQCKLSERSDIIET